MDSRRHVIRYTLLAAFFASLVPLATGCSKHLGPSVEVPLIPTQQVNDEFRARMNVSLSLGEIKDVRKDVIAAFPEEESQPGSFTHPQGEVSKAVEASLVKNFGERGISVTPDAPVRVWGEVRKWRTRVHTTSTSRIRSEASIYLEILDRKGKTVYSGTYHGSRSSEFPIASNFDIKSSLGLAMSHAVEQVVEDEEFLASLWPNPTNNNNPKLKTTAPATLPAPTTHNGLPQANTGRYY